MELEAHPGPGPGRARARPWPAPTRPSWSSPAASPWPIPDAPALLAALLALGYEVALETAGSHDLARWTPAS